MKTFMGGFPNHLYIHWPFCSSKCHFCDFVAFEQHEDYQEAYHKTLYKEIETFAQTFPLETRKPKTIFIGGGTPSLYPLDWMEQFFDLLKKECGMSLCQEVSMESNPADITEERLDAWDFFGITRLSMGVQCLNDDVLFKLGRRQRKKDVYNAIKIIPKYIDNLSIDLILGLPGVSVTEWKQMLKEVVSWPINHISIYFLMIHEKTPLYFKVERKQVSLLEDEKIVDLYDYTVDFLAQHGFEQYEISNFAKQGYTSLHNQAYWDRSPYKGFGVGSSSFDGKYRLKNDPNLENYLKSLQSHPFSAPFSSEEITKKQELLEVLMLGLRQKKGVDLHHVLYSLESDENKAFIQNLSSLIKSGFIEKNNQTIRLTRKGMALENEVIIRLV